MNTVFELSPDEKCNITINPITSEHCWDITAINDELNIDGFKLKRDEKGHLWMCKPNPVEFEWIFVW